MANENQTLDPIAAIDQRLSWLEGHTRATAYILKLLPHCVPLERRELLTAEIRDPRGQLADRVTNEAMTRGFDDSIDEFLASLEELDE